MNDVPASWALVPIGALCDLINGRAFKPEDWQAEGLPIIRIQNLNNPDAPFNRYSGEVRERFLVKDGELLFAWSGTPGTSFGAHVWNRGPAILNQHIFRVLHDARAVDRDYFKHAINHRLEELISKAHGGVGLRHVTKGKFEETEIPLPPLAEQRRILTKLDHTMARTARARTELARIPILIASQKRAILAMAFRGGLCGKEPSGSDDSAPWALPSDWEWTQFRDVVEIASNLVKTDKIPNLPHIAPDNIEGKTARLLPFRTILEDGVISPKHRFSPGQVLFSKIRPYLRKAVLVDFEGACSADMYPLSPSQRVAAKYLLFWLISEDFASFSFLHEGRSVLPKINQDGLNQTPFPLPPMSDQLTIVARVESAFASLDKVTHEHAQASRLLDHLDQAVLAKAFRGELVPQDPADEPAATLLARIGATGPSSTLPARSKKARA